MKYYKYLVILGVFFIGSLTAYLLIDKNMSEREQAELAAIAPVKLISFDSNDIASISYSYSDGSSMDFVYDIENDKWTLPAEPNFKFESTSIAETLVYFSELYSVRKIEENPSDLAKYGLDAPVTVTCVLEDSTKHALEIGNPTVVGDSCYIRVVGEDIVYTTSSDVARAIALTRNNLREKFILNASYPFVTRFKLERGGETIFDLQKVSSEWKALAPFDSTLDLANVTTYITALLSVNYYDFIEEDSDDISKYGLDNPTYAIEMSTAEKDVRIIFGDTYAEDAYIYAQYADSSDVVSFELARIPVIFDDAIFIYTSTIYMTGLTNISKADIIVDGERVTITSDIYDDIKEYGVNGIDITGDKEKSELFEEFFSGAVGIYFDYIDIGAEVDTSIEPAISIDYTNLDGSKVSVAYYRCPEDSTYGTSCYYAVIDGEYTNFIVRDNALNDSQGIRKTYASLMDALK